MTVRNSTISGNTSGTNAANTFRTGGGIYMRAGGTLLVAGLLQCLLAGSAFASLRLLLPGA